MIRCLAVDDEPLALELIADNINQVPFLGLAGTAGNPMEAISFLDNTPVDLLFLDIRMPGISGLDFLRTLRKPPLVICITAYDQYAIQGFELEIVDYLLKPVAFSRFLQAANKARELFLQKQSTGPAPKATATHTDDFFFVHADYSLVKVRVDQITYISGLKDYVKIYLSGVTKPIVTRMSMKSLEERLPEPAFIRVHKSYLVALSYIDSVRSQRIAIGDAEIPVSESYRDNLHQILTHRQL